MPKGNVTKIVILIETFDNIAPVTVPWQLSRMWINHKTEQPMLEITQYKHLTDADMQLEMGNLKAAGASDFR